MELGELSERKQYTVVNKIKSKLENIIIGVPQGSVLGPLPFLIYVNDIGHIRIKHINDIIMLLQMTQRTTSTKI